VRHGRYSLFLSSAEGDGVGEGPMSVPSDRPVSGPPVASDEAVGLATSTGWGCAPLLPQVRRKRRLGVTGGDAGLSVALVEGWGGASFAAPAALPHQPPRVASSIGGATSSGGGGPEPASAPSIAPRHPARLPFRRRVGVRRDRGRRSSYEGSRNTRPQTCTRRLSRVRCPYGDIYPSHRQSPHPPERGPRHCHRHRAYVGSRRAKL